MGKEFGSLIYEDIIKIKNDINISTKEICRDLSLDEEVIAEYFIGKSKTNLLLGFTLLDYLERKQDNNILQKKMGPGRSKGGSL